MGSITDELLSTDMPRKAGGPTGGSITERLLSTRLGDMPMNSVMTDIEPGGEGAGLRTQFKAGFVDEPTAKVEIYSAARFPDLSREERLQRYGLHKGEVVYKADDGKIYYETPDKFVDRAARWFVQEAGTKSPEWALSAIGAYFGGIPGAGGGAAVGEAIRKGVGKVVFDEDQSAIDWAIDVGGAGATGILGESGGKVIAAGVKRGARVGSGEVGRLAQQDLGRAAPAKMMEKKARAEAVGIDLTLPELSESPSLTGAYRTLRGVPGEAGEKIRAFESGVREPQIQEAIETGLEGVAPRQSTYELSDSGVSAARTSLEGLKEGRAAAAKPLYEAAFASGDTADISPVLDLIDGHLDKAAGANRSALAAARRHLTKEVTEEAVEEGGKATTRRIGKEGIEELHEAKLAIDAMLEKKGTTSISNVARKRLTEVKEALVNTLADASPDYEAARKVFEIKSVPIDDFVDSLAGRIAKLEGDDVVKASKMLFGPHSSPEAITRARMKIAATDPEAWNGLVRAYLQDTLESATESVAEIRGANVVFGGKFRKAVFGSRAKREKLRAALSMNQYKNLSDLMLVLEDTVRAIDANSDTAFKLKQDELIKRGAGGQIAKWLKRNPLNTERMAKEIENIRYPKYAAALAEALIKPGSYKQLLRLKQIKPGTEQAIKTIFLISTITGTGGLLPEEGGTRPIGSMQPKGQTGPQE